MKLEEMMNTEKDDVKKILDRHSIKNIDDIEYGSDVYDELFDYFSNSGEMPYGVMKARTGMPDEWIADRINDLEILLTILITSNNVDNFFVCIKFIKFNFFDLTILFNKDTTSSI